MIGQTISHYKILEKLGQGGMGIVYKAQDSKLDRTVALKFLPPPLAASEQDKARFVQEAKAAAALNHPNVCSIIDIQEHDGQMFIVMEFVDGETLREKRGNLSFKQAADIGIQIADGLAAAHEKGIVHRDIKPENIMIRKDGIAQIMDFGLAKLRSASSKVNRLTKEGSTVGTAGYMSPEQVQGQDVDHRSDIFSFGVLLYEMFAGELPFKGVHETALAYEIVNVDPAPISSVKPDIDPALDAIVLDCLEKDAKERCQSVAEVGRDLRKVRRESTRLKASRVTAARPAIRAREDLRAVETSAGSWKMYGGYVAAGFLGLVVVALLVGPWRGRSAAPRPSMRFSIDLTAVAAATPYESELAFSRDGKALVYMGAIAGGSWQLYYHRMDQLGSVPIPGTERAISPAFSPDGQWVAFNAPTQKILKTSVSGGVPEELSSTQITTRGITWPSDDVLYAGSLSGGIVRLSASGGPLEPVTLIDSASGELSHRFPQLLPGGKAIIYTVKQNNIASFDEATIVAERLGSRERRVLVRGGTYGRYEPTGQLFWVRNGAIMAQTFDADRLEVRGAPVTLEKGGWMFTGSGEACLAFSEAGTMVFGPLTLDEAFQSSISWMDRSGVLTSQFDTLRWYNTMLLSPDGQKVAVGINAANDDIWLYQMARGVLSRLTFGGGNNGNPIWSPDGKYIVYAAEKGRVPNLYRKPWDGSGGEERLAASGRVQVPVSFTPDGKALAFNEGGDIWVLPMDSGRPGMPKPFIHSPAEENGGIFSPDGRWISYISNESGKNEVYVTAFPKREGKWQISNGGGYVLFWSRDGKELFFVSGTSLMAVQVIAGATFDFSLPRKICEIPANVLLYDISPDGGRFLAIVTNAVQATLPRLEVVTDWFEPVKEKFSGSTK